MWLDEYRSKNGYEGARKALTGMAPDEIVTAVKDAGLKGRGGAGFSTGLKWSLMPKDESMNIRYLLCNADEMEPGTYKDRLLMEQLPHLLVEGMLISAFALKAYRGYIFLRGEYIEAAQHLRRAIAEATEAGLLGKNILGTGFDFELFVHTGAGRYICGEETALINSLEGRRANPRSKPPFPASSGVWGKPTCVNNVETLCNVPAILANGVEWYQNISTSKDAGTKLMGFSGRVKNPGVWELPFGTTAREILEDYAGGMRDGLKFKARNRAEQGPTSSPKRTSICRWNSKALVKRAAVWAPRWRWPLTTRSIWSRWCATLKSSLPASPAAGVRRAAMVCRGA